MSDAAHILPAAKVEVVDVPEGQEVWCLGLYVAGQSPKSLVAIANLEKLSEKHLARRYQIETIDLVGHPTLARDDDVLAIPTLVRRLPAPAAQSHR